MGFGRWRARCSTNLANGHRTLSSGRWPMAIAIRFVRPIIAAHIGESASQWRSGGPISWTPSATGRPFCHFRKRLQANKSHLNLTDGGSRDGRAPEEQALRNVRSVFRSVIAESIWLCRSGSAVIVAAYRNEGFTSSMTLYDVFANAGMPALADAHGNGANLDMAKGDGGMFARSSCSKKDRAPQ